MAQRPAAIPPSTTTAATATSNQTGGRRTLRWLDLRPEPVHEAVDVLVPRVVAQGDGLAPKERCELVRQLVLRRQSGAAGDTGDDGLAGGEHGGDLLAHVVARLTETWDGARPLERGPIGSDDDDG